jgi:hypothetical protein
MKILGKSFRIMNLVTASDIKIHSLSVGIPVLILMNHVLPYYHAIFFPHSIPQPLHRFTSPCNISKLARLDTHTEMWYVKHFQPVGRSRKLYTCPWNVALPARRCSFMRYRVSQLPLSCSKDRGSKPVRATKPCVTTRST